MKLKTILSTLALALTLSVAMADSKEAPKKDAKAKPYPLTTCAVSGEKLGEMGDPYVFVHEGQEIKLCCKSCQKDFKKDPTKYLKKISEAEKAGKTEKKETK